MPATPELIERTKLGQRFKLGTKVDSREFILQLLDYVQALEDRLDEYDQLHASHETRLTAGGL